MILQVFGLLWTWSAACALQRCKWALKLRLSRSDKERTDHLAHMPHQPTRSCSFHATPLHHDHNFALSAVSEPKSILLVLRHRSHEEISHGLLQRTSKRMNIDLVVGVSSIYCTYSIEQFHPVRGVGISSEGVVFAIWQDLTKKSSCGNLKKKKRGGRERERERDRRKHKDHHFLPSDRPGDLTLQNQR